VLRVDIVDRADGELHVVRAARRRPYRALLAGKIA
jgi:hypothetical protein